MCVCACVLFTYVCIDYDSTALVARKHGAVVCPRLTDIAGESVPALHERLMRNTLQQETGSCANPLAVVGCSDEAGERREEEGGGADREERGRIEGREGGREGEICEFE